MLLLIEVLITGVFVQKFKVPMSHVAWIFNHVIVDLAHLLCNIQYDSDGIIYLGCRMHIRRSLVGICVGQHCLNFSLTMPWGYAICIELLPFWLVSVFWPNRLSYDYIHSHCRLHSRPETKTLFECCERIWGYLIHAINELIIIALRVTLLDSVVVIDN